MAVRRRADIVARLRQRIVTASHLGVLTPGDRLPSSRELAREFRANERVILAAYRVLARDGLVQFRPRSGVYLAPSGIPSDGRPHPQFAEWALDVAVDGLSRGIPPRQVPRWLRQLLSPTRISAILLADNADSQEGITAELRQDYGLNVTAADVRALHRPEGQTLLRGADLVITTPAHAQVVAMAAGEHGKPSLVLSVRTTLVEEIDRLLHAGPVYMLATDPRFARAMRARFASSHGREHLHVVTLGTDDIAVIPDDAPLYVTTRARQQLEHAPVGTRPHTRIIPIEQFISEESARELLAFIVRTNLVALTPPPHHATQGVPADSPDATPSRQ